MAQQFIPQRRDKFHFRTGRTANPVFLGGLNPVDIVYLVEIINQALGIF